MTNENTVIYLQDMLDDKDKLLSDAEILLIGAIWAIEDGTTATKSGPGNIKAEINIANTLISKNV